MNKLILKKLSAIAATIYLIGVGASLQAQVSGPEATEIRSEINALVSEYAITRDSLNAEEHANTFAEQGTMELYGTKYDRDAIRGRLESSDPSGSLMHHMSTGHINIIDAKSASGVHYFTLYAGRPGEDHEEGEPLTLSSFVVMGKYHDDYTLTNDGWKFASRRVEAIFRPAE